MIMEATQASKTAAAAVRPVAPEAAPGGHRNWRPARAAARLGAGYEANREVLEPLARLVVDVLAVVALLSRRSRASAVRAADSETRRS
jgi:hypothetical protein